MDRGEFQTGCSDDRVKEISQEIKQNSKGRENRKGEMGRRLGVPRRSPEGVKSRNGRREASAAPETGTCSFPDNPAARVGDAGQGAGPGRRGSPARSRPQKSYAALAHVQKKFKDTHGS